MTAPTAATAIVAGLRAHGADRLFCVAGESYLPVLDALHDEPGIDVVTCRHEGSAGFAALADAKLTGRPGICAVSRGPGAANAAIAVHAAAEDGAPLLLLVGGVPLARTEREPFQGLDCARFFGGFAKAVWTLHDPANAGELVARAVRTATAGTPGPVVLVLPEDVLAQPVGEPARLVPGAAGRVPARAAVPVEVLAEVRRLLCRAERPLIIAGAAVDSAEGRTLLRRAAERHDIPVVTANKRQHLLANRHPQYAGHLSNSVPRSQLDALARADLILAVGTRLDNTTTAGRRLPGRQPLVHVHPDAQRIGTYHPVAAGCAADPAGFLAELAGWERTGDPHGRAAWSAELHGIEAAQAVWHPVAAGDGVVFGAVVAALDELTGGDATVVVDSGTFTAWVYRHLRFGARGRLVGISSSAMGFGPGAGVAAALRPNGGPTVVVVGDGGLVMNPGELATACERQLDITYIVANNASYGTIRVHQERHYPGRTIATDLANPDFAVLAESFGALGLTAGHPDEIRAYLAKALRHPGPAVLEVRTSLEHVSPSRRLNGTPS
ncbi:thiamine pyrophosphate-dependent enzyme [Dactylosporangium sp. NPDC049140]|uniref:thiamine pyrophosphate-dependent enzyme n=1 Tax=Dactylosporangium sp. NPDC049140 TaxID=3155647 RepID=UPI0033E893CC